MTETQETENLLAVYLIVGEDELKRRRVSERLHKRLRAMGDLSFNSDTFEGTSATGEAIVAACNTVPFVSPVRLVEVSDVEKLSKTDTEALISYIAHPCSTTVLTLTANKLAKSTRLYKAVAQVGAQAVIDCTPFKRADLSRTVRAMATGHGFTMTEGAARALVLQIGDNTVALDNELKKLGLTHRGNDPVSEHEILENVTRRAEVKPWEFVDAFAARNLQKALWCLNRMESTSPHALLAMCTTRIRELITAQSLQQRGEIARLASVLRQPDWRVKNLPGWARLYHPEELRSALKSAAHTERAMKSGAPANDTFLDWVLKVAQTS